MLTLQEIYCSGLETLGARRQSTPEGSGVVCFHSPRGKRPMVFWVVGDKVLVGPRFEDAVPVSQKALTAIVRAHEDLV